MIAQSWGRCDLDGIDTALEGICPTVAHLLFRSSMTTGIVPCGSPAADAALLHASFIPQVRQNAALPENSQHAAVQGKSVAPRDLEADAKRFGRTFGFYEGQAAFVSSDGWHHICADGAGRYPGCHAWSRTFERERCTVQQGHEGCYRDRGVGRASSYSELPWYRRMTAVPPTGSGGRILNSWRFWIWMSCPTALPARDEEGYMNVGRSA